MNRLIVTLVLSFVGLTTAHASRITAENSDIFFIFCGSENSYFKKLEWKDLGNGKPVFLKKGDDEFRVEVFFARFEKIHEVTKKVLVVDSVDYYLRKDGLRLNGSVFQNERVFPDDEKIVSLGRKLTLYLYVARKDVSVSEVITKASSHCLEDAKDSKRVMIELEIKAD